MAVIEALYACHAAIIIMQIRDCHANLLFKICKICKSETIAPTISVFLLTHLPLSGTFHFPRSVFTLYLRTYRGPVPPKLTAGHYAAVYGDELWVFPGPRNPNMMRVYCCDLTRYRWHEREVRGEPPMLSESRRNLDCFLDGKRLIVFGTLASEAFYATVLLMQK